MGELGDEPWGNEIPPSRREAPSLSRFDSPMGNSNADAIVMSTLSVESPVTFGRSRLS